MADINNFNRQMALIKILDPGASLKFSEHTKKWYVSSRIEIKSGGILSGVTPHGQTPEAATNLFLCAVTSTGTIVVTNAYLDNRREWVWNRMAESWAPYYG